MFFNSLSLREESCPSNGKALLLMQELGFEKGERIENESTEKGQELHTDSVGVPLFLCRDRSGRSNAAWQRCSAHHAYHWNCDGVADTDVLCKHINEGVKMRRHYLRLDAILKFQELRYFYMNKRRKGENA
jgi:hypothetical protein